VSHWYLMLRLEEMIFRVGRVDVSSRDVRDGNLSTNAAAVSKKKQRCSECPKARRAAQTHGFSKETTKFGTNGFVQHHSLRLKD
jgi:hypothetical protein